MKIEKKDFEYYINTYEEDEIFYRNLYQAERQSPDAFSAFLESLDMDYLEKHQLFVPAIHKKWSTFLKEEDLFSLTAQNIIVCKHNRYSPEYIHEHEFYEVFYVYSGQCMNTIQGEKRICRAGDICILPPKTNHSIGVFDDSILLNIVIKTPVFHSTFFDIFPGQNALSQFFSHILYGKTENNYLLFHTGNDAMIRSLIEDLYIEYVGHDKYYIPLLSSSLMTLWSLLLRRHEEHMESFITTTNKTLATLDVLNYFQEHYADITLESAARHFGFSVSHFSKLIKDTTGQNFVQIIRSMKLDKACHALKSTNLSIAGICEIVGYSNPEHFTRVFKKEFGVSPGEYRRCQD